MRRFIGLCFATLVALFSTAALAATSTATIDYNAPQSRVHVHVGKDSVGVVRIDIPADAKACSVGSVAVYEHDDGSGLAAYPNHSHAIAITSNPNAVPTNYGFSEKDIYIRIAQLATTNGGFACSPMPPGSVVPELLLPGHTYYIVIARKPGNGANSNSVFSFGVELRRPH